MNSQKIWIVIAAGMTLTAVIVGIGIYVWQRQAVEELTVSQQLPFTGIGDLLRNTVTNSGDQQILLTPQNRSKYSHPEGSQPACEEQFNASDPITTSTYMNRERGISFDVPYNQSWGGPKYRLNPFDENEADVEGYAIEFGPIHVFEGCSWVRDYWVNFLDPEPVQEYINKLTKRNDYPDLFGLKPTIVKINGLQVVKYEVGGLCTYPTMVVMGRRHNYEFVPTCGNEGDFRTVESVIRTVRLLE